jgi:DNA-binding transcriptional LysR family regulator
MSLSHLKIRHLMLITHLVDHGTLHKTAKYLSISQPAASAMLSDLETLLGTPLFVRSRLGVAPTAHAAAILDGARTILNEFSNLTGTLARAIEGRDLVLRVGLVPQIFVSYLPLAIEHFRAAGGCPLRAQEGSARQLIALLLNGSLDCMIGRLSTDSLPPGSDTSVLAFTKLYAEELCVVSGTHETAMRKPTFADLAARSWVLQRRDSGVRRDLNEAFLRNGYQPPEPVVETTNYIQSLAIIGKSDLYTIAPRRTAEQQQRLGNVRIIDFPLRIAPMQVSFIYRKTALENRLIKLFKDCFEHAIAAENLRPVAKLTRL